MLFLGPDRLLGAGKAGVGEGACGDADKVGETGRLSVEIGVAVGAEMKSYRGTTGGGALETVRGSACDGDIGAWVEGGDAEDAACSALTLQAVAERDFCRLAVAGDFQCATVATRCARRHGSASKQKECSAGLQCIV